MVNLSFFDIQVVCEDFSRESYIINQYHCSHCFIFTMITQLAFEFLPPYFNPFKRKTKKQSGQQPTHQATSAVNLTATGKLRATVSHRQTTDDPTWQHVSCLGYRPPPNLVVASRPTPRGRPHPGHRRITSHVCYFAVTQASPMGTLSKPNLSSPILHFRGEMVLG